LRWLENVAHELMELETERIKQKAKYREEWESVLKEAMGFRGTQSQ
jgi:hypothetical protein